MSNVIKFPEPAKTVHESEIVMMTMEQVMQVLTRQKTVADIACEKRHDEYLNQLRAYGVTDLRRFWDEVNDETSFYEGPEGMFDCADIHRVLNEKGDGIYCAV